MRATTSKCVVCGASLPFSVGSLAAGPGVYASLCASCLEQQAEKRGGLALRFRRSPALSALGFVLVTRAAIRALADSGQHALEFLRRHAQGDHGEVARCLCQPAGAGSQEDGRRAFSVYRLTGGRMLAVSTDHWADESVTTLGVPRRP